MDVLQLDVSGRPQAWLSARNAALLYATDEVAWTIGDPFMVLRGGVQRHSGLPSRLPLHPIVAVRGSMPNRAWRQEPALSNPKLFARDRHLCAYCGQHFPYDALTREHIVPTSRGGRDSWRNCITACKLLPLKTLPVRVYRGYYSCKSADRAPRRTRNTYQLSLRVRRGVP